MLKKIEIIAFYLPQFHPFKENDEWWGKGFTEWTNVGKAKSLFKGHDQPRVPTELGYYDLRLPIVREQQAQLAREAGVTGFCYWHYWFGNGKRLIADIFNEVLEFGKPDFPFCLGWANHSWFAKDWNSDGSTTEKLLIEQTYPGMEDARMHFEFLVKAFKDSRYIKIEGRPILYIFRPDLVPTNYLISFRKWAKEAGFPDLYIVGTGEVEDNKIQKYLDMGCDAVSPQRLKNSAVKGTDLQSRIVRKLTRILNPIKNRILHRPPFMQDYRKVYKGLIWKEDKKENVIPYLIPQWDHTPRSGWNGSLFVHSTPEYFYLHAKDGINAVKHKKNPILFIKSWNEWGEGNYMEPDITNGKGFIKALRKAVDEYYSE